MKNTIPYLLTICLCGSLSMFGQTEKAKVVKPLEATCTAAKDKSTGLDLLPTPQWEEGYATITGKTLNYDPAKVDNHNARIYPRSSFGSYLDKKHGTVAVDSSGNYNLKVKLYQTHQPCFIDIPGYYGLMYLSPGENVNITVDYAGRRQKGHQGNDGTVLFVDGVDCDINNMLATNAGHNVIWNSFGNNKGFNKEYPNNAAFIDAVMTHRASQYSHVDTFPFTERMKQLLRLNIDCDAAEALLVATINQIVKPDFAYYSFIPALGVNSPMLRWAADYDGVVSYCSQLHLFDDGGHELAQMSAEILEGLIATGKLDADETELVEGMLKYNIDKEMKNDDFSRQSSAFFTANDDAISALLEKYDTDYELIKQRRDMELMIKRFAEITGIDDVELRQNMIISTYSGILSNGTLLPDAVFEEEIKDFSPVAVSFLTEQNDALRQVLANAVSNVSQMSPDNDGDKIILNLVEKHKGKMIFIDIWNTWCGACLAAMADHEQEKANYTDKVAFVYLADETSPEALWNERIKNFTGDHYRLPLEQHQSLMQRFNFQGYPSYIIIASNGDILSTTNHIHSLSELDEWLK